MSKNKTDIVNDLHKEGTGNASKDTITAIVTKAFTTIAEQLKAGEEVRIDGFGTFSVKDNPERPGRNPATGEAMTIKASKAPKFKPMPALKNALNS